VAGRVLTVSCVDAIFSKLYGLSIPLVLVQRKSMHVLTRTIKTTTRILEPIEDILIKYSN
jgi:hypothetical protein